MTGTCPCWATFKAPQVAARTDAPLPASEETPLGQWTKEQEAVRTTSLTSRPRFSRLTIAETVAVRINPE